jgi:diadenylate cyclase
MEFAWVLENLTWRSALDIALVGLIFFGLSFFLRGTQAIALLRGMIILLITTFILSSVLNLQALRWLLENALVVMGIAVPILFQPELRRMLERVGRGGLFINRPTPESIRTRIIDEISQAAEKLSERRHGALIVLQRQSDLEDYVRTGISLNSDVSAQLLLTIFWPKTELHDGAAIIKADGRLASAASVLPLSASRNLPNPKLGTRHRAGLGISEVSDAICVVVSEETGSITLMHTGRMIPKLDAKRLKTVLSAFYGDAEKSASGRNLIERGQQFLAGLSQRKKRA